jgi:phospholipase C
MDHVAAKERLTDRGTEMNGLRTVASTHSARPRAIVACVSLVAVTATAAVVAGFSDQPTRTRTSSRSAPSQSVATGIHKIKHIVIIMQENRSFDTYFGTFPGADGIPRRHGRFTVCIHNPLTMRCQRPFLDNRDRNVGGPHGIRDARRDINGGRMNGFIRSVLSHQPHRHYIDVMGYHNARTIPNYWAYARHFVLQDHLFASSLGWSLPQHLYMVSEWSAKCRNRRNPMSCTTDVDGPLGSPETMARGKNVIYDCAARVVTHACRESAARLGLTSRLFHRLRALFLRRCDIGQSYDVRHDSFTSKTYWSCRRGIRRAAIRLSLKRRLIRATAFLRPPKYPWTDLTYLLHRAGISWRYYVHPGAEPDCDDDSAITCRTIHQSARTPGNWNPLPNFETVQRDHQRDDVQPIARFYPAARAGRLPAVSWIIPSGHVSEHPPDSVAAGQAYVTGLINTTMRSPDWKSTAIFVSWDDWGGFYDHLRPPRVDSAGYGLRVPGLVISPYAKRDFIDHQVLSHDAYFKFIEDDFLSGSRINPRTDGRPDSRPDVRENEPELGDLRRDFDFNQRPRAALILPNR